MHEEEIQRVFMSPAGYLGPVKVPALAAGAQQLGSVTQAIILDALPLMLADTALKGRKNLVAGANKENYHLKNVTPLRDFHPTEWVDLRNAAAGEGCPNCGEPLVVGKAMEIGHIFKLGNNIRNRWARPCWIKTAKRLCRLWAVTALAWSGF